VGHERQAHKISRSLSGDGERRRLRRTCVFDTGFGFAWFLGSWLMGVLYQKSIPAVIVFSVLLQLLALPFFLFAKRMERQQRIILRHR
jgi:hypothetical protein